MTPGAGWPPTHAMSPFGHVKAVRDLPADRVKGAARMVLLILATHCNKRSECWPSVELLARECALTQRGVRKALAQLRDAGLIEVVRRGPKGVNVVQVDPERGSAKESKEESKEESNPPDPPPGGEDDMVEFLRQVMESRGEQWRPSRELAASIATSLKAWRDSYQKRLERDGYVEGEPPPSVSLRVRDIERGLIALHEEA